MNSDKNFQKIFELGMAYAQQTNFLPSLINAGFYSAIEDLVKDRDLESKDKTNRINFLEDEKRKVEDQILRQKDKLDNLNNKIAKIESEIEDNKGILIQEINVVNLEIDQNQKDIEKLNADFLDLSKNPSRDKRGKFRRIFLRLIFGFLTTSLLFFYWSAWYNGIFSDMSNQNPSGEDLGRVFKFIINPYFIYEALKSSNYLGVSLALALTGIPFGVSYIFHRAVFEKKYHVYGVWRYLFSIGAIFIALLLDFLLAYKIVEEIYNYKQFYGQVDSAPFSIRTCLSETSFWIIFLISFITYFAWGIFFDDIISIEDPAEIIKRQITQKENLNKALNDKKINLERENSSLIKKQNDDKSDFQKEIKILESEMEKALSLVNETNLKIKSLDTKIPISKFEVEMRIEAFLSGWSRVFFENHKVTETNGVDSKILQFDKIKNDYIEKVLSNDNYFITEN